MGQIVKTNNLQKQYSLFEAILWSNIHFPDLTINDFHLIALGTYQIKQAKFSEGEHFRVHEMVTIKVCRDQTTFQSKNVQEIDLSILRTEIKSRHIGNILLCLHCNR